jgi:hypothetical protein
VNHFAQRCKERGVNVDDPDMLAAGIRWAIENERDDLVQHVMTTHEGRFWRFAVPCGTIHYTLTGLHDAFPRTIITPEILRNKKWARKRKMAPRHKRVRS